MWPQLLHFSVQVWLPGPVTCLVIPGPCPWFNALVVPILTFVIFLEQGAPHFHFILGQANYVAGLVLSLFIWQTGIVIFSSSLGTQDSPRKAYANGKVELDGELNLDWLIR